MEFILLLDNPILLFKHILKGIYLLSLEQKDLKKQIAKICYGRSNTLTGFSLDDIDEKYQLELPVQNQKEFNHSENLIKNDKTFCKEFVSFESLFFWPVLCISIV